MHQRNIEKIKSKAASLSPIQRALIVLVIVGLIAAILLQISSPKRSVTVYCKVLKEENARLSTKHGNTYATSAFKGQSSDPHDFVVSLRNLEKVSPDEIRPDVKTLRLTFEKIEKDPSQLLSAGFGSLSAEDNVEHWNKDKCGISQQ